MRTTQYYEIEMLNQKRYRGEIAYREEKLMLTLGEHSCEQKLRIFYEWVVSIRNLVERDLRA